MRVYKQFSFIYFQTRKEMTSHIPGTLGGIYFFDYLNFFAILLPE